MSDAPARIINAVCATWDKTNVAMPYSLAGHFTNVDAKVESLDRTIRSKPPVTHFSGQLGARNSLFFGRLEVTRKVALGNNQSVRCCYGKTVEYGESNWVLQKNAPLWYGAKRTILFVLWAQIKRHNNTPVFLTWRLRHTCVGNPGLL
jgi:hypothetical protein